MKHGLVKYITMLVTGTLCWITPGMPNAHSTTMLAPPHSSLFKSISLEKKENPFSTNSLQQSQEFDKHNIGWLYYATYRSRNLTGPLQDLLDHIDRGRTMAEAIADLIGINPSDRARISLAFALHDVGKLYNTELWNIIISDEKIPYDPDNPKRQLINNHAWFSYRIIVDELGLTVDHDVLTLVVNHHHPERIQNRRLRRMCEIIYWSDICDAMTAVRQYQTDEWNVFSVYDLSNKLHTVYEQVFKNNTCIFEQVFDMLQTYIYSDWFTLSYPEVFTKPEVEASDTNEVSFLSNTSAVSTGSPVWQQYPHAMSLP
ncbi:MAG: HD domain-containing protein, partial [Elusimicrobia bacterium]|nr:HD domain-containing protein [Elusimicrobiota bacterium]MBD3412050.1 HD domain-containing protein [Elusimicrobiota bacterium]